MSFPVGSDGKDPAWNAGDPGLIPGSGRSPREGNELPTPGFLPGEFHGQEPRGLQSVGLQGVEHNSVTNTFTFREQDTRLYQ